VDKVSAVLLADGWHKVKFVDGESTFGLDAYEYVRGQGQDAETCLGGGQCEGVPSTGATWFDADGDRQICCPLTSILAVALLSADEEPATIEDLGVGGAKLPKLDF
jgi:hypothetical protein